ncbi:MAG: hypothetical protein CL949_15475 [Erythrobacter sp.]|nr:hypothetical protein [Erythrobacter sp.]
MTIKKRIHAELTIWDGNPRPAASEEARAEMKASLLNVGQLMPIITRPTATGAEVIAGQNRFINIGELIASGEWPADRAIIVDERKMDDATALEIATSENISISMHPMHQFEAFSRLIEMGRTITDIANGYGVSTRIVEQRLSYAKLEDGARALVKENERDLDWASAMTMASPAEQKQILDEINAEPRRYRSAHEVRSRLQDQLVSLELALFNPDDVEEETVRRDLFDPADRRYMKQSDFIPLQDAALKAKVEERQGEGWAEVKVLNERDYDPYRYNNGVTDKAKAMVVFVRYPTGEIVEHAGVALRHEERVNDIDDTDADAASAIFGDDSDIEEGVRDQINATETETKDEYVEGPKTLRQLEAERAAVIQKMILQDSKLAMVTTIAGLIGNSAARPLAASKTYSDLSSLDENGIARSVIETKNEAVAAIFKTRGVDVTSPYKDLMTQLAGLTNDELMLVFQTELARTISSNLYKITPLYENLIEISGTSSADHWSINRAFLGTLTTGALKGLGNQILPERLKVKLGKSKNDMIETIAQIADDARQGGGRLAADERAQVTSWAPGLLATTAANDDPDNPFAAANDTGDEDSADGAAIFA